MDGVITGCDHVYEWMLDWWWSNYAQHNQQPVSIMDFGMSDVGLQWCKSCGLEVKRIKAEVTRTWFLKPFALLDSAFDRTIWIDLDCEVVGNISPIFEFTSLGMAVTYDPYTPFTKHPTPIATGVVAVDGQPDILRRWVSEIIENPTKHRGDQEALNAISSPDHYGLVIMPYKFQNLRLDKKHDKEAVIIHWTGSEGKKIIKEKIRGTVV